MNGQVAPAVLGEMRARLHDLCQPLTVLQFRLEWGKLTGGSEALLEAVEGGLEDTQRMIEIVHQMRSHLERAATQQQPGAFSAAEDTGERNGR